MTCRAQADVPLHADPYPSLDPSPLDLAVRLEAAFSCLTAIWPGDMSPESAATSRLIACVIDCHHPVDGIERIVRDLWPRIRARALSGE